MGVDFTMFDDYSKSAPGAGKIIPGPAPKCVQNMVQFRGICIIHPAESLPTLPKSRRGEDSANPVPNNIIYGVKTAPTMRSVPKNHYVELRG